MCVAQTRTLAIQLRMKKPEVEGTAAQQHTALDWRWKIRGLSFVSTARDRAGRRGGEISEGGGVLEEPEVRVQRVHRGKGRRGRVGRVRDGAVDRFHELHALRLAHVTEDG